MIKSGSATILSSAVRFTGELIADDDVILAGQFEGVVRTARSLQVANTGILKGEAHADSVVVLGRVDGPIYAVERIELQPGSCVNGDLVAQRVRIHDDVIFNGHCRITGTEATRRQYLLPTVLHAFGTNANLEALAGVQTAAEGLLREFGFDLEVKAEHPGAGTQTVRPIFRSRDALPYSRLRERLRSIEEVLQSATLPPDAGRERRFGVLTRRNDKDAEPLQVTGADGARALIEALGHLHTATLILGPVILTRVEEGRGPRLTVRVRQDGLPSDAVAAAGAPDPSQLLLSLQKVQTEVVRDLGESLAPAAPRSSAGA